MTRMAYGATPVVTAKFRELLVDGQTLAAGIRATSRTIRVAQPHGAARLIHEPSCI